LFSRDAAPQGLRWLAAYAVTYPFTFTLLCCSKLLVLSRLMDFSKLTHVGRQSRWLFASRALVACVVLGNMVGLGGNIAASVSFFRAANLRETRASLVNKSLTSNDRDQLNARANDAMKQGMQTMAIFIGSETILLLLIVIAVSIVGVACVLRIRASLRAAPETPRPVLLRDSADSSDGAARASASDQAYASAARYLKLQIMATCAVVFLSFFIRSSHSIMHVLAQVLASNPNDCPRNQFKNRCSDCYNIWYYLSLWLLYNPALYFGVALFSLPLTLLVALWGMTSGRMAEAMRAA
jgi:hypothetical protein